MSFQVLIIEDEAPAFRRLQKLLEELDENLKITEVFDSVEESVAYLSEKPHPDLIFMDIQLSDGLSFEIFDLVDIDKPVIFTTAFDDYMLKAFKVNSVDYLLKPIKKEDLAHSLAKFKRLNFQSAHKDLNAVINQISLQEKQFKQRFLVRKGEQLLSIPTENVMFFYTEDGLVFLKDKLGQRFVVDFSLDDLEGLVDPKLFFRANRQSIVHLPFIHSVHKWHKGRLKIELSMESPIEMVVSAEKSAEFKNWFGGDSK